ncbi:hypothetical protein GOBAR_AA09650 [Gossypium barbadense]|uniref:Uncharacterized protein n=1 Tax=Gossypium barbadense TaxID=3634 RepID=A0A2P5Y5X5_GOSBA|nr:hypothetical protein GOBAR_AA09650 [Gossypium barbadense]
MFELKGKEKVNDVDRSWLELLNGVEASTSSESEKLQKLTQMVLPKVEEGKQDYLIGKQKKQKTSGDRKK